MKMKPLTIIAAVGNANELGKDNSLLWHLPDDFTHFKTLTMGHHIIMGRRTWESLPGKLPGRTPIIISRNPNFNAKGEKVVQDIETAISSTKEDPNPFVIGGGEIYKLALPFANKIELTKVNATFNADTFFPEIDTNIWKLVKTKQHPKDAKHQYAFTFLTYLRK